MTRKTDRAGLETGKPGSQSPIEAAELLRRVSQQFKGFVPNVYRALAQTPAALHTFVEAEHGLETSGLLDPAEQACVALEVANHADCNYCRSVFILEARRLGVAEVDIEAMATGDRPPDTRCHLVVHATRRLIATRGRLGDAEQAELGRRGLDRPALIEVVTLIAAYTLATFSNNLTRTRIDPEFRVSDHPAAAPRRPDGENV